MLIRPGAADLTRSTGSAEDRLNPWRDTHPFDLMQPAWATESLFRGVPATGTDSLFNIHDSLLYEEGMRNRSDHQA